MKTLFEALKYAKENTNIADPRHSLNEEILSEKELESSDTAEFIKLSIKQSSKLGVRFVKAKTTMQMDAYLKSLGFIVSVITVDSPYGAGLPIYITSEFSW